MLHKTFTSEMKRGCLEQNGNETNSKYDSSIVQTFKR